VRPLDEESVRRNASSLAGVYEILVGLTNGESRRIYVGQASCILDRLSQHERRSENDCVRQNVSKFACYFRFAPLATQWERDGAERGLYLKYLHSCNDPRVIPASPDVLVIEE
jgi:hypothetical protein